MGNRSEGGKRGKNLEVEIINRERDIKRHWEDNKIAKARYNRRYKEIRLEGRFPRYLKKENRGLK